MVEGLGILAGVATPASERSGEPTVRVDRGLLDEARGVSGIADERALVERALTEFVERQRFLSWVAAHERD